jgi:hypothetical protein
MLGLAPWCSLASGTSHFGELFGCMDVFFGMPFKARLGEKKSFY